MRANDQDLNYFAEPLIEAANAAGIGLVVTTARTGNPRTLYASDAVLRLLGRSREELLALPTLTLIAPAAREHMDEQVEDLGAGAPLPAQIDTVVVRPDGTTTPVELKVTEAWIDGARVAVSFVVDVTHRRAAEQALRSSEARFRMLIERAPEAVWIMEEQKISYVNAAALELFGYHDASELIGAAASEFVHPDDLAPLEERAGKMLVERQRLSPFEYRIRRRDGAFLTIDVSSMVIDLGGVPGVLSFGRDVTERRQIEAQLLQADRLAALGLLAGGMAHAINNPLSYVLLNLEHLERALPALAEDPSGLPGVLARLTEACDGAARVAKVVRNMRAFSRVRDRVLTPVDVREILAQTVSIVENEIKHRGSLIAHYEDVPPVMAGEGRLEQVFLNLLVHAAQSLPEDEAERGELRVSARLEPSGLVVVEISDNGPGTARHERPRSSGPPRVESEQQARDRLGLPIVSSVVSSMGGSLHVESRPGRGTTYRVELPAAARPDPTAATPPSSVRDAGEPMRRARILVLDDDPGVSQGLKLMLGDEHEVLSAPSVEAALPLLLAEPLRFDVVLCDLMMPVRSGLDLFEELGTKRPDAVARVVFMTGGAYTPEAEEFLSKVPNPRLDKPFDLSAVRQLLRAMMA